MSEEVAPWTDVRTFHPEMTLRSSASLADTLAALDVALARAKFKIHRRQPDGFEARYLNWFSLVSGNYNKTTLTVSGRQADGGADLHIAAYSTGEHLVGPRKAAGALSTAVRDLRAHGAEVTTTPWAVPEERRQGRRR